METNLFSVYQSVRLVWCTISKKKYLKLFCALVGAQQMLRLVSIELKYFLYLTFTTYYTFTDGRVSYLPFEIPSSLEYKNRE